MLDERDDPALVTEIVTLARALIVNLDAQSRVQEREFAKSLREHIEGEVGALEYFWIWRKRDAGTGVFGDPDFFYVRSRLTAFIGLTPNLTVASNLEREMVRERVDDRDTNSVEAARDLVGLRIELSTCVQGGHHNLGCGPLL